MVDSSPIDRLHGAASTARERAAGAGDRASRAAGRARNRAADAGEWVDSGLDRAEQGIERAKHAAERTERAVEDAERGVAHTAGMEGHTEPQIAPALGTTLSADGPTEPAPEVPAVQGGAFGVPLGGEPLTDTQPLAGGANSFGGMGPERRQANSVPVTEAPIQDALFGDFGRSSEPVEPPAHGQEPPARMGEIFGGGWF